MKVEFHISCTIFGIFTLFYHHLRSFIHVICYCLSTWSCLIYRIIQFTSKGDAWDISLLFQNAESQKETLAFHLNIFKLFVFTNSSGDFALSCFDHLMKSMALILESDKVPYTILNLAAEIFRYYP